MDDFPAVSVILPTYNRAGLLSRAIDSVLQQTFENFELIVVDDASDDETPALLSAHSDARIRVIRLESNKGQAHARNVGIEAARAPLLAFQDADDVWYPFKLQRQVDVLEAMPGISVVYSDMRRIRSDGTSFVLEAPTLAPGRLFDARRSVYSPFGLGIQSCLARRSAIVEVGGFDARRRVWDDMELFLRLIDRGYGFHRLPEILVDYHETAGVSRNEPEKRRARLDLLRTYGYRLAMKSPGRFVAQVSELLRS